MRYFFCTAALLCSLFQSTISHAYEVAVLKSADIRPYEEALQGFRSSCGCRVTEIDQPENDLAAISSEDLRSKPDGVLAIGLDALGHLGALGELPVVFTMVPDQKIKTPLKKNVSGVYIGSGPEKYIHSIQELFPSCKRIGLVYDPKNSESFVQEAMSVAESRGINLVIKKAGRPEEVPSLIESMRNRIDLFWMLPDATILSPEATKFLLLFSFQSRVPVFTFSKKYVEMGAVAGLNSSPFEMGVQAAEIMKRAIAVKGSAGPVRAEPKNVSLIINSKVANKMGITIREDLLRKAEHVNW